MICSIKRGNNICKKRKENKKVCKRFISIVTIATVRIDFIINIPYFFFFNFFLFLESYFLNKMSSDAGAEKAKPHRDEIKDEAGYYFVCFFFLLNWIFIKINCFRTSNCSNTEKIN